MIENYLQERAILVGLDADIYSAEQRSSAESLDELAALLTTAGGIACGRLLQKRRAPDPHSFIGPGKVQELKAFMQAEDCTIALFDNELSPSQMRALSAELEARVVDRSGLILDIFAQRAQSREGRLQVQLAQYKYTLPRLTGMWTHLDRETSSGSSPLGSRGTGETQLESDRRIIRRRIDRLEAELVEVRRSRATQRSLRQRQGVPVAALVGYTNAGKSTLLNALTGADIPARDRLFDTLDTTTRRLTLENGRQVLLSDTVGFIRKLPHHLVEAFKATLEELAYADLILHVVDVSHREWREQAAVAEGLIDELARPETPRLTVYNKADLILDAYDLPEGKDVLLVSAATGRGLPELLSRIGALLEKERRLFELLLPYGEGGLLERLHREGRVLAAEYQPEGVRVTAEAPRALWERLAPYDLAPPEPQEE
ncbi:MAG: GTPase HflX [Firmicutes bacterium]|nr:GTPase HflX [Bacillota bacterium]